MGCSKAQGKNMNRYDLVTYGTILEEMCKLFPPVAPLDPSDSVVWIEIIVDKDTTLKKLVVGLELEQKLLLKKYAREAVNEGWSWRFTGFTRLSERDAYRGQLLCRRWEAELAA